MLKCICGGEGPVCSECQVDMDAIADILEKRPYDGPMGIFEDYDGCDSNKDEDEDA